MQLPYPVKTLSRADCHKRTETKKDIEFEMSCIILNNQKCPEWPRVDKNGQKGPECPKCPEWPRIAKKAQNGPKGPE